MAVNIKAIKGTKDTLPSESYKSQYIEQAALDMQVGEIRTVKGDYGVHIIKKYPMDAEKYISGLNMFIITKTVARTVENDRIHL